MKRLKSLILLLFILPFTINAQETIKQKELGITAQNLKFENFGLTYKFGKSTAMWRFNGLAFRGNSEESEFDTSGNDNANLTLGVGIGREKRKKINDNFEFRYGLDLSFAYSKYEREYINEEFSDQNRIVEEDIFSPKVNLIFGVNYVMKNNTVFGLEVLPDLSYRYRTRKSVFRSVEEDYSSHSVDFGTGDNIGLLSLAYRF